MVHIDFKDLRCALLKALRGRRSQMALSRRIGYSFNQVYRWESGRTGLGWDDFERFCRAVGADLSHACRHQLGYVGKPDDTSALVQHLTGSARLAAVAKATGISRMRIERWRRGGSMPMFEDVLQLLEGTNWSAISFVTTLVKDGRFDHWLAQHAILPRARRAIIDSPWVGVIDILFELDDYRRLAAHEDGFVARKIGCSLAEERRLLAAMETSGMIAWEQKKYRSCVGTRRVNTKTIAFAEHAKLINFWLAQASAALERQGPHGFDEDASIMGYRVLCVSKTAYEQICQRFRGCFSDIGTIIRSDQGKPTVLRVLNQQLFDPLQR